MQARDVPILLLVFNRLKETAAVLQEIALLQPRKLYIAADGPRGPVDGTRCKAVRRLLKHINWRCQVKRLYRETNLGCRFGPSTAISWFFEHEPEGIILEDDCIPVPSFFPYCAELLERYRADERVLSITGDNFQKDMDGYPHSYYFSNYFHGWGWASWARAWKLNDDSMRAYPEWIKYNSFDSISKIPGFANYWQREFNMVQGRRQLQAWDYVWMFSCWTKHGLSVVPNVNLVSNIGWGRDATHCHDPDSPMANLPRTDIRFPLDHPDEIRVNRKADDFTSEHIFRVGRYVPAV